MKHTISLLILTVLMSCSQVQTPQQMAEAAVKNYLMETLDNPEAYEPVSFSVLDTVYTSFDDIYDSKYRQYARARETVDEYDEYIRKGFDAIAELESGDAEEARKVVNELRNYADSVEAQFVPRPERLSLLHTFRCENKYGAIVKESHLFSMSLDFTGVRCDI